VISTWHMIDHGRLELLTTIRPLLGPVAFHDDVSTISLFTARTTRLPFETATVAAMRVAGLSQQYCVKVL
jgi:hypothetical protein